MSKYRIPQTSRPRKVKLFERVVGQPVAIIIPDGYREMQAKLNAPRPVVALTIRVRPDGQIKSLRLAKEREAREPAMVLSLDHPFVVKLLANYSPIGQYQSQGVTVYTYALRQALQQAQGAAQDATRCPEGPALVQTGPGSYIIPDDEALPRPLSPAALIAEGLKAEFPALASRIAAALELIETGQLDLARHKTWWDNAGYYGTWHCDCPDARYRKNRTKYGAGCKHALGGLIEQLAERERKQVAYRELASDLERRPSTSPSTRPSTSSGHGREPLSADVGSGRSIEDMLGYASPANYRPGADPVNLRSHGNRAEFKVRYGGGK